MSPRAPRGAGEQVLAELLAAVPPPAPAGDEDCFAPPQERDDPQGRLQKCSFDLPHDLARSFRALCAIQGVKQRRVIERLVRAYVRQHARAAG